MKVNILVLTLLLFLCSEHASALDPHTRISQYSHVAWSLDHGLSNAAPNTIVQSADGYIWIGTETGLLRFDGVRFVQWTPPHWNELSDHQVIALYPGSDGALWIGTLTNLAFWKNGRLTVVDTNVPGLVASIVEDRDHNIWFTTIRRRDRKGLCRVTGASAKCFGEAEGLPPNLRGLRVNPDGSLSTDDDAAIIDWSPTKGVLSRVPIPGYSGIDTIVRLSQIENQPDGSRLAAFGVPGPGRGLQRLIHSAWSSYKVNGLDGSTLNVRAILTDHHGALWIGTDNDGIYRIAGSLVDHYGRRDGLSGNSVRDVREDREGNIWVATDGGIDCFSSLKTITWSTDQGLLAGHVRSVLATHDNSVLVGMNGALNVIRDGKVSILPLAPEFASNFMMGLLEDRQGRYWIGTNTDLVIFDGHRFTKLRRPDGQPISSVFSMDLAPDGSVWAQTFYHALPRQLLHFQNDKLTEIVPIQYSAAKVVSDRAGGAWVDGQGQIIHYTNGSIKYIALTPKPDDKNFSTQDDLIMSPDGTVFVTSRLGLWVVRGNNVKLMDTSAGLPCQDVNGLVFSQTHSLWMRTNCGLIQLTAESIDKWWSGSHDGIRYRMIDSSEGARPSRTFLFPQMSEAPDGRIWVGYDAGVQEINPNQIPFNPQPPPVHIEEITVDHERMEPTEGLRLHPLVRDLEIRYTALSFTAPQKVRFKYRLEGRDSTWQDPVSRRAAFYNDLKPGHYRFHVIAANNDGVWNNTGDSLDFYVKPAWFQTVWFKTLAVAIILGIIWLAHRMRLNIISNSIEARFNERLAERTRVARELHDTVLQTVQGGKLVADKTLASDADELRLRSALERLSLWLGQAITEGRSAVYALRASTMEHNELAEFLHTTLKEHCNQLSISAEFVVVGDSRNLHAIVLDELSLIAREAICNACLHSNTRELRVELVYGENLRLSIKDTGAGIAPDVLNSGKAGHFGLQSMRERSERIHANITISSSPGHGTEVCLRIPGKVAYKRDHVSGSQRIKAFFGSMKPQRRHTKSDN